jgi:SAM-dependent methyltransferase
MNTSDDRWVTGDAYEAYMGRWSRSLARTFAGWLRAKRGAHWLEVGCGTGALTSTICHLCEPASVVACDPSEPFIEHARRNLSDARASFVIAGSEALPSRDGGFDVVVSGLVLNFLPDPGAAVASFRERLRPGGIVAAYVWDYAEGMGFLRCFWDEAVASDPRAGSLDEGRRFPLCRRPALASLFRAAGLAQVETGALEIPTDFSNFDDYWTPFLCGTGPAPSYVASLDPPGRELLRGRLTRRLHAGRDGRIRLRARAWAVRGVSNRAAAPPDEPINARSPSAPAAH